MQLHQLGPLIGVRASLRRVITRVAKELGIGSESLLRWVTQADGGPSPETSTVDAHSGLREIPLAEPPL